jgi:hypothetical protein
MAWTFIYEDLSEYSSDTNTIDDLPLSGVQGIIVDGKGYAGFDSYGILPDGEVILARAVVINHPDAKVISTRTIPTRQFHHVEKRIGLWLKDNVEPFQGWNKDVVGVRVWTSTGVFDTKGLPESEWRAWWIALPDDIQEITLYENWFHLGEQYRQFVGGGAVPYYEDTPWGPVIGTTDSPSPLAVVKGRKNVPARKMAEIRNLQTAATVF